MVALGAAGLVAGWAGSADSSGGPAAQRAISITGAWVRQPVPPIRSAAAYFTVHNTTSRPDELVAVTTDAGTSAVLHTAGMTPAGTVTVPAHGALRLSTGHGHVMIQGTKPEVSPGHRIQLDLRFIHAGVVSVQAPVISYLSSAPTSGGSS